jgi:hypothetical protein
MNDELNLIEKNGVLGIDCDGRFIPAISGGTGYEILAIAAIGAVAAAYGSYKTAETQQETLKTQAKIREEDAAMTRAAGEAAAARQRKHDAARLNSFAARAGAAGVVAREGSSLLAEMDYATDSEIEAQHVKYGYELGARSKNVEAQFSRYQAGQINPEMAAGISLMSSAGSIATSYYANKPVSTEQTGGGLRGNTGGLSYSDRVRSSEAP